MALKDKKAHQRYQRLYYKKNKALVLRKTAEYAAAHPEVRRRAIRNRTLKEHDMTEAEYAKQVKKQKGKCAICRQRDVRDLSIDHDHECCAGERSCKSCNRGLLCNVCNKKLAAVEDAKFLRAAIKYLKKWKA